MRRKTKLFFIALSLSLFALSFTSMTYAEVEQGSKWMPTLGKTTNRVGDAYRFNINNIDMPLNRSGVMANVTIGNIGNGQIDGKEFLFSGGFFLSGITNGFMWSNAVASASRIQDYAPGTSTKVNDPKAQLYLLRATDSDFSESWLVWKDAVALGAYFYDGDSDGVYNPVDKNGNGKWDRDEDRPDLIGDETVWCVYTDAIEPSKRRFIDVPPQGIDIRQSVFGFKSKGIVGNMIFLRYSILNTGTVADVMDSVYFGVWADPDLGDYTDDLVGSDTTLNAGYVYNDGDDPVFGVNPPTFLIDFFQGPIAYIPGITFTDNNGNGRYDDGIDTPRDTASNVQGQVRGVVKYPGAKNLGLSSFVHYMQSHATLGDPSTRQEARSYMLGRDKVGNALDPCTFTFGTVKGGIPCATVNNKFWYSGDPVTDIGWINNLPIDQRQMSNTGPFRLEKGKPVDIVVAYVVARGTNALNSITKTKEYDKTAQKVFDLNFPSPPPPPPIEYQVKTGNNFIDMTWNTDKYINYRAVDTVLDIDRRFEGYYVTAYKTNTKQTSIAGVVTAAEVANYDVNNFINNIYTRSSNGGIDLIRSEALVSNKMSAAIYGDSAQGRIKLRIDKDPFTGAPLIKGKEYYFAITAYFLNHRTIVNKETNTYGPSGDYVDLSGGGFEEFETQIIKVVFGRDLFEPASIAQVGQRFEGFSDGKVGYVVTDNNFLTGDEYTVEFFKDRVSATYSTFWRLKNKTKGLLLIDSSKVYNYDTTNYSGIVKDGFVVKIQNITPTINFTGVKYNPAIATDPVWYSSFLPTTDGTGVFYVGKDIPQGAPAKLQNNAAARSDVIKADKLRRIEIRFGTSGKAHRYLNGFIGSPIARRSSFAYAKAVTATDTTGGRGTVGKFGEGFVDVPFTAWVKDTRYNEERQLAVAFIEQSSAYRGKPDGIWDPTVNLQNTGEVIVIFDAPYDPTGSQIEYTGGVFGTTTVWSDIIRGFTIPDTNITKEKRDIAKSPWFNAMYVVGLQRKDSVSFFKNGDILSIPMSIYGYTDADKYTFRTLRKGELNAEQKKALFEKVNVFPNPLFAYNPATSYENTATDEPFVTFSNLPTDITVKIYSLSGILLKTLTTSDKATPSSPFLRWNLENEEGLRVASGMYLAIVTSPEYGEKILKFAIVMPQKQIQRY